TAPWRLTSWTWGVLSWARGRWTLVPQRLLIGTCETPSFQPGPVRPGPPGDNADARTQDPFGRLPPRFGLAGRRSLHRRGAALPGRRRSTAQGGAAPLRQRPLPR